jgi:hypothetical protein
MGRDYASTMEGAVTEFADIFASELPATVYLAGSIVMLVILATAVLWMGREPAAISAFEFTPAYGL